MWFTVAPEHAYKADEHWSVKPDKYISSGPFILTKFDRGIASRWDLNPSYKGVRRPYMTQIREETLPTGLAAYIAGDLQAYTITAASPAGEVALVNSDPLLRSESHPGVAIATDYLGFNTLPGKAAPLDNPDVRLALSKAIDKATIVGDIWRGFAATGWGLLPKGFPNYNGEALKELEPNKYDPEAARALLAKAGFAEGKGFPKFEMWIRAPGTAELALCQAIQANWKDNLGIQVELKPADFDTFTTGAFSDKVAPIYFVQYALDYFDPATFLNVFRSGGRHPHIDDAWDEFYNKANSILDPAERFKQLKEAEKMLVDSTAWTFLDHPFTIELWHCNLSGEALKPNKDGYVFKDGGAPGIAHVNEGSYWSDSKCRG